MNNIAIFEDKKVRRVFHNNQWMFSVVDVCSVLSNSQDANSYWRKLKQRLIKEESQVVTKCHALKLLASDGKRYKTDCAIIEDMFRIIQSIPSQKAEKFKEWLAQVGSERVEEIKDPSKSIERGIDQYRKNGRDEKWIKNRIQGIADRKGITGDWNQRGITEGHNYARLTDDIHNQAFGMKTAQHKEVKGLTSQNLRDHMDELELATINIGEIATRALHKQNNSYGMQELREDAIKGGRVARDLRENLEKTLGRSIITSNNYLINKTNHKKD